MKISFVQTSPAFLEPEKNVERALQLIDGVEADLIVLPELFNTGYNFASKEEVARAAEPAGKGKAGKAILEKAEEKKCMIVAGFAEKSGARLYNSALVATPKGFDVYRKIHLFNREKLFFSPGDKGFRVFEWKGAKVGVMICFDWFYPESMRTLMLKGAEVIAHPANLVLPWCPEAMKTRCLENRVFAVTADRIGEEKGLAFIGQSQITGVRGEVFCRASEDQEEAKTVEINLEKAREKKVAEYNDIVKDRRKKFYL